MDRNGCADLFLFLAFFIASLIFDFGVIHSHAHAHCALILRVLLMNYGKRENFFSQLMSDRNKCIFMRSRVHCIKIVRNAKRCGQWAQECERTPKKCFGDRLTESFFKT